MTMPMCTCPERGSEDWNGNHEIACPWRARLVAKLTKVQAMGKHVVPASSLDNERLVWLRPDTDPKMDPGWRFRLEKERGDGHTYLFEERVLPEHVGNPTARRIVATKGSLSLNRDDLRWLRDALTELLDVADV